MHNRTAPSVRCQTSSASHLRLHAHRNISQSLTVKTASSSFSNYVNNFQQRCLCLGARDSAGRVTGTLPGPGGASRSALEPGPEFSSLWFFLVCLLSARPPKKTALVQFHKALPSPEARGRVSGLLDLDQPAPLSSSTIGSS